MKIFIKCLFIGLLCTAPALSAVEGENGVDERLISPAHDALVVSKQKHIQDVMEKLQISIKNLYALYQEGDSTDEELKEMLIQLTSRYLALKKIYKETV